MQLLFLIENQSISDWKLHLLNAASKTIKLWREKHQCVCVCVRFLALKTHLMAIRATVFSSNAWVRLIDNPLLLWRIWKCAENKKLKPWWMKKPNFWARSESHIQHTHTLRRDECLIRTPGCIDWAHSEWRIVDFVDQTRVILKQLGLFAISHRILVGFLSWCPPPSRSQTLNWCC